MADIRRYSRTTTGKWRKLPWRRRLNTPSPKVLTNPTIIGAPAPGQTLTWAGGTYEGTEVHSEGGEWTLYNTAGAVLRQSSDPSFKIPAEAPSGRLEIAEHAVDKYRRRPEPLGKASVAVTAVVGLPEFTRAPVISVAGGGSPTVGAVLNAVHGAATGSPAPTITGEWFRGTTPMGVTALSYTISSADVGYKMTYLDTGSNSVGSATSRSNEITAVAATQTVPAFTAKPSIARNATTGVFTATQAPVSGNPTPTVTGQWYIASSSTGTLTAISGARDASWTPTALYFGGGYYVSYQNSASNSAGGPVLSEFADRVAIPATEGWTANPALSGDQVGTTLSVSNGTYRGTPTKIEYVWYSDGAVGTVTTQSWTPSSAMAGKKVKALVRLTYASGNIYEYTTAEVTIRAAGAWPALTNILPSASNASKKWNVMDYPYVQYQDARATLSSGNWCQHGLGLAAYAAWQSNDDDICDWVEAGLKDILVTGNDVRLAMGYGAMYPMTQVTAIYFANKTSKIKSGFTSTQWNLLDAVIKLAGIAAASVARDTGESQKDMAGDDNASTITGGSNPNIRMPHYSIPQMLCAYLGSSANGKTFFEGVTESSIKALRDLVAPTMPRTASAFANTRPSGAPTFAKMVSKCNNYVTGGLTIDDHVDIYVREMNFCYDKAAFLGLNNGQGSTQSDGGQNIGRGRFDNVDTVKNLQAYKDIAGEIGMCHELNTSDGAGDRSSMGYAGFADGPSTCYSLGILTSGLVPPSNSKVKALAARFKVNQAFNQLADAQTYLSCAQSGPSSTSRYANSESWSLNGSGVKWMVPPRRSAMQAIIDIIDAA